MKITFLPLTTLVIILCVSQLAQAQWVRQYPLPKLEDVRDIDISPDGYGFAAGSNDLLLRLEPVSKTWELLQGYGGNWRYDVVDYLDGSEGTIAVAGGQGTIFTFDKGESWNVVPGAPINIHTLRIFSPTYMIAVSAGGAFEWRNGIWTDLNDPAPGMIKGAFILDSMHIWVYTFAANSAIYYTSNGGMTWNTNLQIADIDVVKFHDPLFGIATDNKDVYQTSNGGVSWTLVGPGALPTTVNDIAFGASADVMMAATINAEPALSIDGGVSWTEKDPQLVNQKSFTVAGLSNDEFWIGNDLSSIIHTENAGTSWLETSGPERNTIHDIFFLTRSVGFASGLEGMLLKTRDGGNHWEDISFGNRSHFTIHGTSENDLWLGANQRILHSVDTGSTWTESLAILGSNINDVLSVSTNIVLASSTTGIIYRTVDAGVKWDTVYNAGVQIRSIARIDDQRFFATGYNDIILRSSDQGLTWQTLTAPEAGLQYEQAHFIGDMGWMVTSSFKKTMWSTTNAGDTWTPITLPVDRFWDGVYFITPDTGVVVGRSNNEGRAYITYTGGQTWAAGHITTFPLYGVSGVPNPNGTAWIHGYGSDIEVLPFCNTFPIISDASGDLMPCEQDTVLYIVNTENAENFAWQIPAGWTITGNPNNDTIAVVVGITSGVVFVSASNACGETGHIIGNAVPGRLPSAFSILGNTAPCSGDTVVYNVISLEANNFQWSVPAGWTVLGPSNEPHVRVIVGNNPGMVSINVNNACGEDDLSSAVDPFDIPDVQINVSGLTMTLSEIGVSYQWHLNGTPIPGATGHQHVATENGVYSADIVFSSGCSTSSDMVTITTVATLNPIAHSILVYPVPAKEQLFIEGLTGSFDYRIVDLTGRIACDGKNATSFIATNKLERGYYLLNVVYKNNTFTTQFIKD